MEKKFYAVKNNNEEDRKKSSSGGAFLAIAKNVLSKNGIVYGAIYNDKFDVVHSRADNFDDVIKMTGSKYSRSDLKNILQEVKKDLNDGKIVLFSGTPCQISTVNLFTKKNNSNLITIDLVCHGAPEKKYLLDYIKYQEKKYNSKILKIDMRYKNKIDFNKNLNRKHIPISPVEPHIMNIDFCDNKKYVARSDFDPFYQLFDYFIGKGCFKCPFSKIDRVSDITLGDFHEFNSKLGIFNDGNGVSLVIINTDKGKEVINEIQKDLNMIQKEKNECMQPALIKPAVKPNRYEAFQEDYKKFGFDYVTKKYAQAGMKYKIKKILYKIKLLDIIMKIKNAIK